MLRPATSLFAALVLAACASPLASAATAAQGDAGTTTRASLDAAVAGSWRDPANVARDKFRHPAQTLAFFGVKPTDTVIEITPGGGWYAEILAPYLHDHGHYIAAVVDPAAVKESARDYYRKGKSGLEAKFAAAPPQYDRAQVVTYDPKAPVFGAPDSADFVLTFRNVHNWRAAGEAEGMFKGFYAVLKPGGTLGVVEHRAAADVGDDDRSGYVGQAQVVAMAEAAGFRLDGKSEINANPKDDRQHPNGVWTLPPSNRHDDADDARYQAIGESDRMTLRFVKP